MRIASILLLASCLTLSAQSTFIHRLNWESQGDPISGYNVYRQLGSNATWLRLVTTTNLTASLTNSTPGLYRYRVTAYNSFGESLPSNEVMVDMRAPRSPTNLVLTVIIPTQ